MPRRNRRSIWKVLLPLGVVAMIVTVLRRRRDEWEYGTDAPEPPAAPAPTEEQVAARRPAARFATAAGFTALFFAGAAFTAGAGDQAARVLQNDQAASAELAEIAAATVATTTGEAEAAPAAAPEPAAEVAPEPAPQIAPPPAEEPVAEAPAPDAVAAVEAKLSSAPAATPPADVVAAAPEAEAPAAEVAAPAPQNVTGPAPAPAPASSVAPAPAPKPVVGPAQSRPQPTKKWVVKRAAEKPARAPEIDHDHDHDHQGEPVVWLNRALPDPTPVSARLARSFAKQLASVSRRHGADWAAVLGVLRAQGERGATPASRRDLETLAGRLARHDDAWKGALAISGRTAFADRANALADLYRSVGIEALVTGYGAAKDRLVRNLLDREGVLVYDGGRADLVAGRIDVRVVVLLGYLAERHGGVTVSSLFTGHRKFSRPGVISAHTYGHAVDIAAVGGTPIAGHQQPGGPTEAAVRSVLLLPSELQPQQVISLLGLGGPSFPMRDHGDHIHIGY